ncbi:hypothetical protein GCM10027417_24150 [Glutamicibacter endophyticus]
MSNYILRSTTSTAPVVISSTANVEEFHLAFEDGSAQVYSRTEILAALRAVGVLQIVEA